MFKEWFIAVGLLFLVALAAIFVVTFLMVWMSPGQVALISVNSVRESWVELAVIPVATIWGLWAAVLAVSDKHR